MQKKRAAALQEEWSGKVCLHESLAREYDMGRRTGAYVCTQCGAAISFRERAERRGLNASAPEQSHRGKHMGKKSSREIPDFSRKASRPKAPGAPGAPNAPLPQKGHAVTAQPPRPKPQATSSKSGQRGK